MYMCVISMYFHTSLAQLGESLTTLPYKIITHRAVLKYEDISKPVKEAQMAIKKEQ